MSSLELREFRRLLEAKHTDLLSAPSGRDEIVIEAAADEIDRLQQQLNREVAIRHLDQKSRLLKNIEAALGRIEDEIYGLCLRCEEPIPAKRLKAIPWASYCVKCQEIADRNHAFDDDDAIGFAA